MTSMAPSNSLQRLVLVGIVVAGAVALFAKSAAAAPAIPTAFHPELAPRERRFVWDEVRLCSGREMIARADMYESFKMPDGSKLSAAALAALAQEAAAKAVQEGVTL